MSATYNTDSEDTTQEKPSMILTTAHRVFASGERRRFILLFLTVNILIFVLIWLSWESRVLVLENMALETRLVVVETRAAQEIAACEIDNTDRMTTMAARLETAVAQTTAATGALITDSPMPDTSTDTPLPTAMWTPTPLSTHVPPPLVLGITPGTIVQTSGPVFAVTIIGQNFSKGVTARLGANISISVIGNTGTIITGTLSPSIPVGVYELTVTNPDGQSATLSAAFTVQEPGSTLKSSVLFTCVLDAHLSDDDEHQVRPHFLEQSAVLESPPAYCETPNLPRPTNGDIHLRQRTILTFDQRCRGLIENYSLNQPILTASFG